MQHVAIVKTGAVQQGAPLFRRFAAKLVVDVVPAALTSVVGGILVAHYQFGHVAERPAIEQAQPASVEMVKLVRDEHTAIMDYLRAQVAAEKSRNAAADAADARAAAEARAIIETPVAPVQAVPAAVAAPKAVATRGKPVLAAAATLPQRDSIVVAQVASAQVVPAAAQASSQQQEKSLLARTLDLKDHVVGATLHAVSAIGGIPSWIASMGDHNDSTETSPSVPNTAGRSFAS